MKKFIVAIKALFLKAIDRILVNDLYMSFHGEDFYFVLWDLEQYLRTITKWNPDKFSSKQVDMADRVRDKLYDLLDEHGVDFNHVE